MSKTPKILIADDERDARESLANFLRLKLKADVKTAKDGQEALDAMKDTDFDVLLLDLTMPGVSGMDILEEVTRDKPNMKIVITTGWDSEKVASLAVDKGALDYVLKPYTVNVIEEKLRTILKEKGFSI